jgi:mRNA-degrading endonuclease YafQ of YafQ-DinJ toxin-antitoxin module
MTLLERRRRTTELNGRWRSTRELLAAALQAMEYDQALVYQIEMDDLDDQIIVLSRRSGHDPYRACR